MHPFCLPVKSTVGQLVRFSYSHMLNRLAILGCSWHDCNGHVYIPYRKRIDTATIAADGPVLDIGHVNALGQIRPAITLPGDDDNIRKAVHRLPLLPWP